MITLFNNGKPSIPPIASKPNDQEQDHPLKLREKLSQRKPKPAKHLRRTPFGRIKATRTEAAAALPQTGKAEAETAKTTSDAELAQLTETAESPAIAKAEQERKEARERELATVKPYDPRAAHPTISDAKRNAWLSATKRIGKALIAEGAALEARGAQYAPTTQIVVTAAKKTASGQYAGTGKIPGIDANSKSSCNAYSAVAMALAAAGLASCSWPPSSQPHIPLKIKTTAADIGKIAVFCGLPVPEQSLMLDAPMQHETPQSKPTSHTSSRDAKAELLNDFAKTCANEKLAQWARSVLPNREPDGATSHKLQSEINVSEIVLSRTLRFLAMHPFPVCPPAEKRILAAETFGKSKALDGKAEDVIAHVLHESGAVQCHGKQSAAETLRCWGVLESGPALSLGGNVSMFAKEHAIDLAALKEHFCVESDFFAQPLQMDAHHVRCLVVVENKAAFRECVRSFGKDALFAYVNGAWNDQAVAALKSVRRLLAEAVHREERQLPTYLWFDMDGGGISRARHLLERLPGSQCVLMSASDYDALYAERGYGLTDGQLINVYNELIPGKLSDEGLRSLAERISEHGRGIEQEAMLTGYAQRRFTELFAKNAMAKREEPREAKPEALSDIRPQADGATEKRRRARIITACAAAGLCAMSTATIGAVLAINQLKHQG